MGFNFKTLGGLIEIKYATGDDVDNLDDEELDYLQEELERLQAKVDARKPKEKKKEQPKTIKEILNDNEIPYEVRMKYIIEAYRKDQEKWGKLAEYAKHLEAEVIRYKEIMVANGYTDNRIEEEIKPSKGNAELKKEIRDLKKELNDANNNIKIFGDKAYISKDIQLDLFETARIELECPYRENQKDWKPTFIPFAKARKRIETLFSQLTDQFLVIRNYAKETCGLFARIIGKISALTVLQYVNYINGKPLGRIKYALN